MVVNMRAIGNKANRMEEVHITVLQARCEKENGQKERGSNGSSNYNLSSWTICDRLCGCGDFSQVAIPKAGNSCRRLRVRSSCAAMSNPNGCIKLCGCGDTATVPIRLLSCGVGDVLWILPPLEYARLLPSP